MAHQPIKLAIIDDHDIMREGLVLLLEDEPSIHIVGLGSNGFEALALAKVKQPHIMLMDISMVGMSGLEATRQITQDYPDIKIIMLTMHEDEAFFRQAMEAGARGYFLKGSDLENLLKTIKLVDEGGTYISPSLTGQ